jgi:hypothetical protein
MGFGNSHDLGRGAGLSGALGGLFNLGTDRSEAGCDLYH